MTTRTVNPAPAVHVREAGDQGPLLLCLTQSDPAVAGHNVITSIDGEGGVTRSAVAYFLLRRWT
ncbi:hypothetical protein, partial [Streptomyces sp. NPDC048845]|uniref:hypothetical protein n=1 Tax=Streptomyces sp. NPDC048845 TaxID=3155390 RepID=UPI00343AA3AA